MTRTVSIFGSTGSVGTATVDLISRAGSGATHQLVALTGGRNVALLAEQARALRPQIAVTAFDDALPALRAALQGTGIETASGAQALVEAASRPVDWAMSAIVGAAGLAPTLQMAQSAKTLALANKESLVCAGALLRQACDAHGTMLLPVDSEHSAIFQALAGQDMARVSRIILTASGGPFRTWSKAEMAGATRAQALKHPNWEMGDRITIDSASLFNKALEVIEAHELFDLPSDRIDVVVHPQSIIHSMVEFEDRAVIAQLGAPDMRGPIGYALNYPDRAPLPVEKLDFAALSRLDFEAPDPDRFPSLGLARDVIDIGGASGAVLNAAKEIGLDAFLAGEIGFLDMAECVAGVLASLQDDAAKITPSDGLEAIDLIDSRARQAARNYFSARSGVSRKAI